MRIDMSMGNEEQRFHVSSWWASSPEFVLRSLSAQLKAAAVIFPDLEAFKIGTPAPKPDEKETPAAQAQVALTAGQGEKS